MPGQRDAASGDRRSDGLSGEGVGERLRITREALGLAQSEFAERCGLARNTYNQYEQGKNIPRIENGIAICEAFGLSLDWIYRGDPSSLPYKTADAIKAIRVRRAS